jgi:succinate dehydrogenase / fumarate reductase, cytochrome b subunit
MNRYFSSSIGKKQIVAISGIGMVLFLLAHLAGNFLIFKGPEALNYYSQSLKDLGALLWVARIGLISMFILHFGFTISLVIQNRRARGVQYDQSLHAKTRKLSTRIMPISGIIVLSYIIKHLIDFTFTHATEMNAVVNGSNLGLYGMVYNSFLNPATSLFYVIAMIAIGFHLNHGIQSFAQTVGGNHSVYTPYIKKIGASLSVIIALGFSSIPLYVLFGCATSGLAA